MKNSKRSPVLLNQRSAYGGETIEAFQRRTAERSNEKWPTLSSKLQALKSQTTAEAEAFVGALKSTISYQNN